MRPLRLLPSYVVAVAVVMSGCAGLPAREPSPKEEHVFFVPREEALEEARALLEERGFAFAPSADPAVLVTQPRRVSIDRAGGAELDRYVVATLEPAPGRTVVRIFRARRGSFADDVEVGISGKYYRDQLFYDYESHPAYARERLGGSGSPPDVTARAALGVRDLPLERELRARLESVPSLETPVPPEAAALQPLPPPPANGWLAEWKGDALPFDTAEPCGEPVPGLAPLLLPGHTLLVGEQPGSREVPQAVGRIACQAARAGRRTTVALALPDTEQPRLDVYLDSEGSAADQHRLLSGPVWRRSLQDGRTSRSMLALIEYLRQLRALDLPVSVLAIEGGGDRLMANRLEERRNVSRDELLVVLAGNAHVRTREGGTPWARDLVPMGALLAREGEPVTALDLAYPRGMRWMCRLTRGADVRCGPRVVSPADVVRAPEGAPTQVVLGQAPEGFDGVLTVGRLSASAPAVMTGALATGAAASQR